MNRVIRFLIVIVIAAVVWSGCGARTPNLVLKPGVVPLSFKILPVPLFAQETRMWCWAASGEMITAYYGLGENAEGIPQVVQANNRLKRNDCGGKAIRRDCIKGGHPEFEKYGLAYPQKKYGALSWDALVEQIDRGNPVAFSWEWKGCTSARAYGSHFMVVRGYLELNGIKMVMVNDPLPVSRDKRGGTVSLMTYDDYVRFCPRYVHAYTLYSIKPNVPGEEQKGEIRQKQRSWDRPGNLTGRTGPAEAGQDGLELLKTLPETALLEMGIDPQLLNGECVLGKPVGATTRSSRRIRSGTGTPADAVEVHYAVYVGEMLLTTVTVRKRDGEWAIAVLGDSSALLAAAALAKMPEPRGKPPVYSILQIYALNLTFLVYFQEDNDQLYLVPTTADPDLNFLPHQPVPAETVFEELKFLLKRWVDEEGDTLLSGRLTDAWEKLDNAILDLESGEKIQVLPGMENAVKIIGEILSQLRGENGRSPAAIH